MIIDLIMTNDCDLRTRFSLTLLYHCTISISYGRGVETDILDWLGLGKRCLPTVRAIET
jgi:hypothetical protein